MRPLFQPTLWSASAFIVTAAATLHAEPRALNLDLPAQSLAQSLVQLTRQGGVQILYAPELVKGLRAAPLKGQFSPEQALRRLLQGSGLVLQQQSGTFVLSRSTPSAMNTTNPTLAKVTVTATPAMATDDPYNTAYNRLDASTATKTDTPIMETPLSIQVVTPQVIKDQQAVRLDKVLENVSGVIARPTTDTGFGSGDVFNLRGFNTIDVYRDGMRIQSVLAGRSDLAAIDRVEVLKGPASILYGRIEPGGLINQVGKQPLAERYWSLQQQFGSFDFFRTGLDATGPVGQGSGLNYRFNAAFETANSFVDFLHNDRVVVAPVLRWTLSPATQITVEVNYRHGFDPSSPGIPFLGNRPAALPRHRNLSEPGTGIGADDLYAGFNWSHAFNEQWTFNHRFYVNRTEQTRSEGIFFGSIVGSTIERTLIEHSGQPLQSYYTTYNLTGHFETWGLEHTLLMGGDYFNYGEHSSETLYTLPAIDIYRPRYSSARLLVQGFDGGKSGNDWYGFYLQDQVRLPYQLHLLAGFRYDNATVTNDISGNFGGEAFSLIDEQTDEAVTPRFGILWRPLTELSLYGSYTENFGAQNGFNSDGKPLPPQTAQQWELGVKTQLFDGKFNGTLAWFDLTKQNIARTDPLNPVFTIATGEIRHQGLELDITGEILPGWQAIGSYAFLESEVTADSSLDEQGRANPGSTGNRIAGTPKHAASLWSTYEFHEGPLSGLKLGTGIVARSQNYADQANNDVRIPGYVVVNALMSYSVPVGKSKFTAQLNVDNLLDKNYFASTGAGITAFYGAPRTFMGSIRVEY